MTRLISNLFRRTNKSPKINRRVQLGLTRLEDRSTPASVTLQNGVLTIIGTEQADVVTAIPYWNQVPDDFVPSGPGVSFGGGLATFFTAGAWQPPPNYISDVTWLYVNKEYSFEFFPGQVHTVIFHGNGGDDKLFSTEKLIPKWEIHGGADNDRILFQYPSAAKVAIFGGNGNDVIAVESTTGRENLIEGGEGNDTIVGTLSFDLIRGGGGNDVIDGRAGGDHIYGERGNDMLTGGWEHATGIDGGEDNDTLIGSRGADTLLGGSGNDLLLGQENLDLLVGHEGDDTLQGGPSNDTLFGGNGRDILFGDEHHDMLNGGNDDDTLFGGVGDDSLFGEFGFDRLHGGDNNDYLDGDDDGRRDEMFGDAGADTFKARYSANLGYSEPVDFARDFSAAQGDRLTSTVDQMSASTSVSIVTGTTGFAANTGTGGMFELAIMRLFPEDPAVQISAINELTAFATSPFTAEDFGFPATVEETVTEVPVEEVSGEMPESSPEETDEIAYEEPTAEEVIDAAVTPEYTMIDITEEENLEILHETINEAFGEMVIDEETV